MMGIWRSAVIAASISTSTTALVLAPTVASATEAGRQTYHLPSQSLAASLRAVAIASGRSIAAPADLVRGKRAPALDGDFAPEDAVAALLDGSGLRLRVVGNGLIIERETAAQDGALADANGSEIVVTGSRIRGAPVASPIIRIDQQDMRNAGQTSVAEVASSIPQNFGGGQNPGVGANVPAASGVNVGSAFTINLRGLGSDATLTLLNGHRLAYNGSRQGIDVSAIPLGIVDRIEIVADGASALYGSDAVAGVANIILKRDYDGLETRANLGGSTDGGNFQQQYGAVAGKRWSSGGLVAAYEFARNTDVLSDDRSYAASRPGVTLYPALRRHAMALAGHQALTDTLSFEMDALFNKRWSLSGFPLNAAGDLATSRTEQRSTSRSFAVAPSLKLDLGKAWRLSLSSVYGEEKVELHSDSFVGASQTSANFICYCNTGRSVELAADGSLFRLGGGPVKLAIGAGYRDNRLNAFRGTGNLNNVNRSQDSYYTYGELNLPLVSARQGIAGIDRLNLSGAVRYERYPGVDAVATPKLGIIYAPVADIAIKGSWGRSFRAPTLFQQYQARSALLYPAASLGGTGYPASATVLLVQGGNPALKPERAGTWTATIEFTPHMVPGLRLQFGYFSTRYTDRIVTPISFQAQALSNPLYADQVTRAPGATTVAAAIANAAQFFNVSGQVYTPGAVVAIVDNSNLNAGRQSIRGIDLLAGYRTDLGSNRGTLGVSLNASYLESNQQLTPGAPILEKAGTLFNPPHWRGRGSVTWSKGGLTLNATASHIGGVEDIRSAPALSIDGMNTVDFTARYTFGAVRGPLHGLELSLTLQNAFDAHPTTIATSVYSDTAYDSTNYSPVGRYIGFGIAKSW
ncbi:TonB-dependent receptor [Novosphingobium sp. SG720]|uniref:TonB-dependent receptor n=1 Tax=Novosphingobium sp. SG720 TaxID=2586998 RepID=UPI0017CBE556|nr:TonB-dependent receptor [Novosphingobium sp. SG720]NKJ43476.1 outer membrane receptor protein involved in Fe transport [Novosphingobium sp. SG720]